jgi:hypothetical protein
MIPELHASNEQLAHFLDVKSTVPIVQVDGQQRITACNNGFLKLFNLSRKPLGAHLADFLITDVDDRMHEPGSHQFLCNPLTGIHGVLVAFRLPLNGGMLLWCERPLHTNNQVVEQMALLNNELIAMQRELTKKNHRLNQMQNELAEKVAQLESTLSYVKRLEGILPVCVYCKNIRDDADTEPGKGKWMRMEEFLLHKSGTFVSHGCCPQCFEKHRDDD